MMEPSASAALYDAFYYQHCCGNEYVRNDFWLRQFGRIADHIHNEIDPTTVLDAGCAKGFLVETLRACGVEAYGIDISDYAIQQVVEEIKPYCTVGSVLDPFPRKYDLIVCIEVLEHLSPAECDVAVANFCLFSDQVLFSSTPDDYREATHINVRPPEYWAGLFARYGFYRDVEYDASYITPWTMRFVRAYQPVYRLVEAYERRLWQLARESNGAREFALESRVQLAERDKQIVELEAKVAERDQSTALLRAELTALQNYLPRIDEGILTANQQFAERDQQATALEAKLAERDKQVAVFEAELAERDKQVAVFRAKLAEREQGIALLRTALATAPKAHERLNNDLQAIQETNRQLSAQIGDILSSPGWRFVTRVGKVRSRLFPPGSLREQWWCNIIKKLTA